MIPKVKIEINLKELYTKQSDCDNTILTCAELNDAIETIHNVNRHSERPKTGIVTKQKIEKPRRCFFFIMAQSCTSSAESYKAVQRLI